MPRGLELLLTVAATAVAVAFFASVPYWPKEASTNALRLPSFEAAAQPSAPILRGTSVLAGAKPAPELNLSLPADIATVAGRRGINGETGLIPTAAAITTFRIIASGDLVTVAAPTGVEAVRRTSADADPVLRVRGAYAVATTDHGSTVIHWTENGVTYEISSRTLDASRLTEIANKLR